MMFYRRVSTTDESGVLTACNGPICEFDKLEAIAKNSGGYLYFDEGNYYLGIEEIKDPSNNYQECWVPVYESNTPTLGALFYVAIQGHKDAKTGVPFRGDIYRNTEMLVSYKLSYEHSLKETNQ
jgi:hypothetical protein